MTKKFGARALGSSVQACPLADPQVPMHWIEIELVGEDDKGVPYESFRVRLPNGGEVEGYLDEQGKARLSNITEPGLCQVCFPNLDTAAWVPLPT
jgi:hypothetical protein